MSQTPASQTPASQTPTSQTPTTPTPMPTAKLTPAMAQYMHFKGQHRDAILFFRMGDFYEMFYDDAREVSRLLGLTLTSRSHGKSVGDVPLAGVPHHAAETYVARLVQMGRKVAICEQVEDPKKSKGIVKRDVVQVISPGTALSDAMLDRQRNNFTVGVLAEGGSVGLAVVDLSTGDFSLDEVLAEELFDELARLGPAEILLGEGVEEGWVDDLSKHLPGVAVSRLPDWQFEYRHAYETLTEQLQVRSLKGFDCDDLNLGVRAGGAAIDYLRDNQRGGVHHINRVQRRRRGDCLLLDAGAQRHLELVANLQDGSRQSTLLEILDQTRTPMGARLMRQWLIAPLIDATAIGARLDAVEALVGGRQVRAKLRRRLEDVGDLERLMARICCQRANARDLVGLARSLKQVPAVTDLIGDLAGELLENLVQRELPPCADLVELVDGALVDDPPAALTEGGLFQSGYNEELDQLRSVSAGGRDWIAGIQTRERERTGINSLKIGFNHVFGYYIEVSKANQDRVPEDYVRKQTLVNAERFITPELKEYEAQVLGAQESIEALENRLFLELRDQTAAWAPQVQQCARTLAQLDVLASLAEVAESEGYTRPAVDESRVIDIDGGRHPVVERQVGEGRFVPNDVHLDTETAQILLITGPNMAGKSTIIRQVGLVTIMAQMGGFVPARRACIGIVDRIFTRVGASDNLARGESTFMVEMTEAAAILNSAGERSLILMDELGRGTSTFDGLSIAWALVEHLHQHRQPRTLFATHYHELTRLEHTLVRVRNHNVGVREEDGGVVFLHRLEAGPCDRSYGINVAQMAGMPESVVTRAQELLASLEKGESGGTATDNNCDALTAPQPNGQEPPQQEPPQLDLFGSRDDGRGRRLVEELTDLDLSLTTPMEALLRLHQWQQELTESRSPNAAAGTNDAAAPTTGDDTDG